MSDSKILPGWTGEPEDQTSGSAAKAASSDSRENGAAVLEAVAAFTGRFVAYPSPEAHTAHVLWIVHSHFMESWDSTPRIAFLSPEPGSGKSRALEVTEPLVPRPVHAVNTTPAYLFRKVSDEAGPPSILYDEIDTVFGAKAKDNEDIRGMLNAGHRRGATAGRCVIRGHVVETEELPAFAAVALAGLGDLPDTIMTRAVVIRMRRRRKDEMVEPWRARRHEAEGHALRDRLAAWAKSVADQVGHPWPEMPEGVEDRAADVWEALLAVADLAGGDWPERARVSAVSFVSDKRDGGARLVSVSFMTCVPSSRATRKSLPLTFSLFSLVRMRCLGATCEANRSTPEDSPDS